MLKFGNTFVNVGGTYLTRVHINYNPLDLPANTIRVKFTSGYTPDMGDTQTLVDAEENIWDIYKQSNDWSFLFYNNDKLLEVLGANTTNVITMYLTFGNCSSLTSVPLFDTYKVTDMGAMFNRCYSLVSVPLFVTNNVTYMRGMFEYCTSLTSAPLFDTSNVTNMNSMFDNCSSLNIIPLYNTSKATDMSYMFNDCTTIESGALALYQQASSQTTPPTYHEGTFRNCGLVTQTGSAELAQIPRDWGGRLLLE